MNSWSQVIFLSLSFGSEFESPSANSWVESFIGWSPPHMDWIALNTDGAYKHSLQQAIAGGVLRDISGGLERWLFYSGW